MRHLAIALPGKPLRWAIPGFEGTLLLLRPVSQARLEAILAAHTTVDAEGAEDRNHKAIARQVAGESIVGWEGLHDADGEAVDYELALVDRVLNVTGVLDRLAQYLVQERSALQVAEDLELGN